MRGVIAPDVGGAVAVDPVRGGCPDSRPKGSDAVGPIWISSSSRRPRDERRIGLIVGLQMMNFSTIAAVFAGDGAATWSSSSAYILRCPKPF